MRKVFMVLAGALITLPIFAQEKKPTVTPTPSARRSTNLNSSKSNRAVQPTLTPGNTREVALGGPDTANRQQQGLSPTPNATGTEERSGHDTSKSSIQNIKAREAQPAPTPVSGVARGKPTKDQRQMTGKVSRVLSQQGRVTFIVLANGKEFTFSAANLKALPKVGDIIDITYTQTPSGPLEAVTINTTKSNSY